MSFSNQHEVIKVTANMHPDKEYFKGWFVFIMQKKLDHHRKYGYSPKTLIVDVKLDYALRHNKEISDRLRVNVCGLVSGEHFCLLFEVENYIIIDENLFKDTIYE